MGYILQKSNGSAIGKSESATPTIQLIVGYEGCLLASTWFFMSALDLSSIIISSVKGDGANICSTSFGKQGRQSRQRGQATGEISKAASWITEWKSICFDKERRVHFFDDQIFFNNNSGSSHHSRIFLCGRLLLVAGMGNGSTKSSRIDTFATSTESSAAERHDCCRGSLEFDPKVLYRSNQEWTGKPYSLDA